MRNILTHRQQEFLNMFLDLYREARKPLPYAAVAEKLGVSNVTAFEMLRLLQERGLVQSEYQVKAEKHGPGRAPVVFSPTLSANKSANLDIVDSSDLHEWQMLRDRILSQLQEAKLVGQEEFLNNLIQKIPNSKSSIIFITEMITAVILVLYRLKDSPGIYDLLTRLQKIGLPEGVSLGVLSGITMLLAAIEKTNLRFSTALISQINRYEEALSRMSAENLKALSEFTREAASILVS